MKNLLRESLLEKMYLESTLHRGGVLKMGGRWSIRARNLNDKYWIICDYNLTLFGFIVKGIYCIFKYEVVELVKYGR